MKNHYLDIYKKVGQKKWSFNCWAFVFPTLWLGGYKMYFVLWFYFFIDAVYYNIATFFLVDHRFSSFLAFLLLKQVIFGFCANYIMFFRIRFLIRRGFHLIKFSMQSFWGLMLGLIVNLSYKPKLQHSSVLAGVLFLCIFICFIESAMEYKNVYKLNRPFNTDFSDENIIKVTSS